MGLIFSQSVDSETITIPVGTTVGTVRVTKNNVTFRGSDRDTCIIQGDATFAFVFQPSGSTPSTGITIENCTIDCNNNASITGVLTISNPDCVEVTLKNVKIVGVNKSGTAILNASKLYCYDVLIVGDGGGIQALTSATITEIVRTECRGCKFGYVNSDAGTNRTRLTDFKSYHHYWASPVFESATVSSISTNKVTVASHTSAARSLYDCLRLMTTVGTFTGAGPISPIGQKWDRLEAASGVWAQIIDDIGTIDMWHAASSWRPAVTPSGTITVWRPTLGKLYNWNATELFLYDGGGAVDDPHWRTVEGMRITLPSATRLDIIRNGLTGGQTKDVDTGGIHITDTARNTTLTRCYVEGGFADMITVRGTNTVATDCSVKLGQDMGFTVDGVVARQNLTRCTADGAGEHGFILINGPSDLTDCTAINNGLHGNGAYDATASGVVVYPAAVGSRISLINCSNNFRSSVYGSFLPPLYLGALPRPRRRR